MQILDLGAASNLSLQCLRTGTHTHLQWYHDQFYYTILLRWIHVLHKYICLSCRICNETGVSKDVQVKKCRVTWPRPAQCGGAARAFQRCRHCSPELWTRTPWKSWVVNGRDEKTEEIEEIILWETLLMRVLSFGILSVQCHGAQVAKRWRLEHSHSVSAIYKSGLVPRQPQPLSLWKWSSSLHHWQWSHSGWLMPFSPDVPNWSQVLCLQVCQCLVSWGDLDCSFTPKTSQLKVLHQSWTGTKCSVEMVVPRWIRWQQKSLAMAFPFEQVCQESFVELLYYG